MADALKRRRTTDDRPILDATARARRGRLYLDMLRQDSAANDPYPDLLMKNPSPTAVTASVNANASDGASGVNSGSTERNKPKRRKKRLSVASHRFKTPLAALIAAQESEIVAAMKREEDSSSSAVAATGTTPTNGHNTNEDSLDEEAEIAELASPIALPAKRTSGPPSYVTARARSKKRCSTPPLCAVCGLEAPYTCIYCGTRYCSIKCQTHHAATRCT